MISVELAKERAATIREALLPHGVVMADLFDPRYLAAAKVSEEQMAEWVLEAEMPDLPSGPPMASLEELCGS